LIPHATDLRIIRTLSRSGLRPLLEGGVRIFEWNGSMMHAKTAVVDGRWSRIGSSNLNIATFIGNYELDVAIDDVNVAREMERMYVDDLSNATEIILSRNRVFHVALSSPELESQRTQQYYDGLPRSKGSAAAAGAIRVANAVSAAMTNHRILGPAEGGVLLVSGVVLLALAVLGALWPPLLALPIALVALYTGLALVWRAIRVRTRRRPLLPAAARMPPAATTSTVAPVSPPTTDAANGVVHEKISEISEPSKKHAP